MKSSATNKFWRAYHSLPPEIRAEARKAYRLWAENPRHPSLRFGRKSPYWSVRIGRVHEGTLYWFWIGPHDEYERVLNK